MSMDFEPCYACLMSYMIREAIPDDAVALLDYMKELLAEPGLHLPAEADEFAYTEEMERRVIEAHAEADNSHWLVAEVDGRVVGCVNCTGGSYRSMRHQVTLGISLLKAHRGQGIGRALMTEAIAWARGTGIVNRIELTVHTANVPAIRLYEDLGFVTEGTRRRYVYKQGQYDDALLMSLLFDLPA
jgi:RimJ/RimL family protein N-acetyltransferase